MHKKNCEWVSGIQFGSHGTIQKKRIYHSDLFILTHSSSPNLKLLISLIMDAATPQPCNRTKSMRRASNARFPSGGGSIYMLLTQPSLPGPRSLAPNRRQRLAEQVRLLPPAMTSVSPEDGRWGDVEGQWREEIGKARGPAGGGWVLGELLQRI